MSDVSHAELNAHAAVNSYELEFDSLWINDVLRPDTPTEPEDPTSVTVPVVAFPVTDKQVADGALRDFGGLHAQVAPSSAEAFVPTCNVRRDEPLSQTSSSNQDNDSSTDGHLPVQISPIVSDGAQPASSGWDPLFGFDHDKLQGYLRENLIEFTWNDGELSASPVVADAPVASSGGGPSTSHSFGEAKFHMRFNFNFCWQLASW